MIASAVCVTADTSVGLPTEAVSVQKFSSNVVALTTFEYPEGPISFIARTRYQYRVNAFNGVSATSTSSSALISPRSCMKVLPFVERSRINPVSSSALCVQEILI